MTFTQQTFLGASIRNFNAHIGWGDQASELTVEVCEDDTRNERFNPPYPGTLVYFRYQNWSFGGLIQSYKKIRGQDGNSLYSIIVNDPRELLSGVQLIINDYTSTTYNVPNLYNIYGYLESTVGFGAADVNSAGTPWKKIRDTFLHLQSITPLKIYDQTFIVDLSRLPELPEFHRISNTNISLMDFISDICKSAGVDFFFRLSQENVNTLTLYTIDRTSNSDPDAIVRFTEGLDGFNRSELGLEFRNEVNNKFLVGGKVQKLYAQTTDFNNDWAFIDANNTSYPYYAFDPIYPFFGDKENGEGVKLAIATNGRNIETNQDDQFSGYYQWASNDVFTLQEINDGVVLDVLGRTQIGLYHRYIKDHIKVKIQRWITVDDLYITDYRELRAALTSQDAWLNFLFMNDKNDNDFINFKNVNYSITNIHKGKFGVNGLNAIASFSPQFLDTVDAKLLAKADGSELVTWINNDLNMSVIMKNKITIAEKNQPAINNLNDAIDNEERIRKIYDVIRQFASEYFGRKFMVSVDFVNGKINRDEEAKITDWRGDLFTLPGNKVTTSWEPALDGGYLDNIDYQITNGPNGSEYTPVQQSEFAKAVDAKLLPLDTKKLMTEDGKIVAYAIFDKVSPRGILYDFSELQESDYVEFNGYIYVKCELSPNLVFLDNRNLFSPRAVITLPGVVSVAKFKYTWQAEMLKGLIIDKARQRGLNFQELTNIRAALDTKFGFANVGQDFMNEDYFPFPVSPYRVVVPLKSNVYTYGPWYTIGANGKTEFEADADLVPWNYGSYNEMNQAAQARIQTGATNQQYGSNGSITFAGVPVVHIGDLLISGGPYLTDLQVDISENGATTTYTFNTWTKQFGVIGKELIDEMRKTKQFMVKQRKAAYNQSQIDFASKTNNKQKGQPPKRFKSFSTHPVLVSDKTGSKNTIVMSPGYHMVDQTLVPSGKNVAALDTLFVPFSTNYNERSQPHFELPSGSISTINATGLNPFTGPHNFTLMTRASHESEEELNIIDSGINDIDGYRTFALRSPLVLAGWGVDINGKPVPNKTPSSPGNEYAPGYRQDPTLWKAGPLHCGWDDTNKMWVATGGNNITRGILTDNLFYHGSGRCDLYKYVVESGKNIKIGSEYVFDWLLNSGYFIPSNAKCIVYTENNRKYVINASPNREPGTYNGY